MKDPSREFLKNGHLDITLGESVYANALELYNRATLRLDLRCMYIASLDDIVKSARLQVAT